MEKEFIPYEQALALKELGFDEPCFGYYDIKDNNLRLFFDNLQDASCNSDLKYDDFKHCTAPTFSQAFRWFREKYGLFTQPNRTLDKEGVWYYFSIETKRTDVCEGSFSYEEAELACLIKLIEIVKNK
jgi:hypothetical protein